MMLKWRSGCVVIYRGAHNNSCNQDCIANIGTSSVNPNKNKKNLTKWLDAADCCAKNYKTWHDIEVQYITTIVSRCSMSTAPERQYFNIEAEDLFICRRGCLHPCKPPPCFDPVYPTLLEKILYTLGNWTALAVLLVLVYGTVKLQVWGPPLPLFENVLGVQQPEGLNIVVKKAIYFWNSTWGVMFSGLKWIFPPRERESPVNMKEFIINVEDAVKDKKIEVSKKIVKEDENTFEEWEYIYKYEPEPPPLKVETVDDADWLWMDHGCDGYVEESGPELPFEQASRMMMKKANKGASMAAAYTDFPSQVVDEDSIEKVSSECALNTLEADLCKQKILRRQNVKINPDNCKLCVENPHNQLNKK